MGDIKSTGQATNSLSHLFPPGTEVPLLVRFYDSSLQPEAKDPYGRTLNDILSWNDKNLERSHNYIQILFPLPEGSPFNWNAPVITKDVMLAFHSNASLRANLLKAFKRMLTFYGFEYSGIPYLTEEIDAVVKRLVPDARDHIVTDKCSVTRAIHFDEASATWARPMDHNHLRLTRIIRCLRILGLEDEARAFFVALMQVVLDPEIRITGRTVRYWYFAVARPLYLAPSDEKCEWLRDWEKEKEEAQKEKEQEETEEKGTEKRERKDEAEETAA